MDLFTLPIVSRSILFDRFKENTFDWHNYTDFILAGPYNYNSSDLESISLVKNPYYWDAENIVIEEIIFRHFSSLDAVALEIQNNTIDIISPLFQVTGNDIQNITDLVFSNIPRTVHSELSLNHKSPYWGTGALLSGNEDVSESDRLIDALKIRRAFSHTIDRSFATFDLLNGRGIPAVTAISPSTFGYQTTTEPDIYSIELAKSLFEEVGYDYSDLGEPDSDGNYNNFFFNLTLMSPNTGSSTYAWVFEFEKDLPKIGVGVNQHLSTGWSEFFPRSLGSQNPPLLFDEGGFDTLAITIGWNRHFSPSSIYSSDGLIPDGGNFYNFQNSSLDAIVADYILEFDCGERVIKLETLKKSLYDNLPIIPILHNSNIWIWRDAITGIDPLLINFGAVDWSQVRNTEYAKFGDSLSDYLWFLIAPLIGAIITWIIFKKIYKRYEVPDSIEAYPELPNNE